MNIRIADLSINWQDDYSDCVSGFAGEACQEQAMSISFADSLPECYGIQYTDIPTENLLRLANGEMLCANRDWSRAVSFFSPKCGEYALPLAAICSRLAYFSTVLLHASFVEYDGRGIVFTGPSGVGKTTQAQLWQNHLGAQIVNGDKVFIRCAEDSVFAYGLPWKGSSPYCLNRKAPVSAVAVLRQAEENSIRKLNAVEATELFLPHVFLPHWDDKCLNEALDTFEKILKRVPVFVLECRADEDAVRLLHDTVFDKSLWKN